MFLGRGTEAARICHLIARAGTGESAVLVIHGQPGIGKSALIGHAHAHAGPARVLHTRATEVESEIPYAHLADLLRPVKHVLSEIPAPQATALAGALALAPSAGGDRFAVAAAALSVFSVLAQDGPVLVTVDDLQWVDRYSYEVITFVGHRLRAEGIVLLLTLRDGEGVAPGLDRFEQMVLGGLDDESARHLVSATGHPLPDALAERLLVEAAGNPLALRELPALLSRRQLSLPAPSFAPLPISEVVEEAFCRSVRVLPSDSQEALLLLAILGSVPVDVVERALAAGGIGHRAVDLAEEAGLLVEESGRLSFRHPLVRAAVHQTAPPMRRRQAHLCAARALEDSNAPNRTERLAWHLVAAGGGPDEGLAAVLERSAEDELARSNFAVAGTLFSRSAQATPGGDAAAIRLLRAAEATRLAGAVGEAREMLVRALETMQDPRLSAVARYHVERIDMWRGRALQGRAAMLEIEAEVESTDGPLAASILTDATLMAVETGELRLADELSGRALWLARASGGDPPPLPTEVVRALTLSVSGRDAEAREILTRRGAEIDRVNVMAADLVDQLVLVAGCAHIAIEDLDRGQHLIERSVRGARDASAVGVLPFRLGRLAWAHYWQGRWTSAYALADEALRLAEDGGWLAEQPNSLAVLARIESVTGRDDRCREHAQLADDLADTSGIRTYHAYAELALGMLALSNGEDVEAVARLELVDTFAADNATVDTPMLWWSADLIEAYTRLGLSGDAERVLRRLEAALDVRGGPPTGFAVAARSRALLEPDDFDRHLAVALRWHDRSPVPFERARTELALGMQLRRSRLRREARRHLESASTTFDSLGAVHWARRSRAELEATGIHLTRAETGLAGLTPQELQVALHVARGLANREVAAQLFLSVKTVEFHLSNAFHKLGISRRTQLALMVAQHEREAAEPVVRTAAAL